MKRDGCWVNWEEKEAFFLPILSRFVKGINYTRNHAVTVWCVFPPILSMCCNISFFLNDRRCQSTWQVTARGNHEALEQVLPQHTRTHTHKPKISLQNKKSNLFQKASKVFQRFTLRLFFSKFHWIFILDHFFGKILVNTSKWQLQSIKKKNQISGTKCNIYFEKDISE